MTCRLVRQAATKLVGDAALVHGGEATLDDESTRRARLRHEMDVRVKDRLSGTRATVV
jgi:hypothetical protein